MSSSVDFDILNVIEHLIKNKSCAQSLDGQVEMSDMDDQKEVNVDFSDAVKQYDLVISRRLVDPTFGVHKNGGDDLATFMQRPIRIYTKTWAVNESPQYFAVFNPWELFLSDSKVVNKLQTFKLLHGTLKLKFVVNGSPFHYGRMFVGVRPTKFDNNTTVHDPTAALVSVTYRDENAMGVKTLNCLKTLYSQRPHVFLDPSTNQPQQITWPFFAQYNWIDLTDPETVNRMGRIEIWELNQLQHSNGSTDPITVSCFAWMEDVTFAGLTNATPSIAQDTLGDSNTPKQKDEYVKDGIISAPASAISTIASHLSGVPIIGRFARATSMVSGAVADAARLFGFSKPVILADTMYMRPQNVANLSNYSGADPVFKLTLDPKQELTIDPATVGLEGHDQMAFSYIAKREAYIDTFNWNTEGTQNTGLLYSIRVHPGVAPVFLSGATNTYSYCTTPVGFVTRPFQDWTGPLKFRFQIVASQMHRGRLLFVYEPTPSVAGTIVDTNDRFAHIVDINKERDVSFLINWTQSNAYRNAELDEATNDWAIEGPTGSMTASGSNYSSNGRINVYVLNELASPIDVSNVQINVFISAGDTFEVKKPRHTFASSWAYTSQQVTVGPPSTAQSSDCTEDENKPEHDHYYVLNGLVNPYSPEQSLVYYGENIVSFRSLLKRYCFHRTLAFNFLPNSADSMLRQFFSLFAFPVGPGRAYGSSPVSSLTRAETTTPGVYENYNICAMTYIRYCASAYVGYRGGVRWKITHFANNNDRTILKVIRRGVPNNAEAFSSQDFALSSTSRSTVASNAMNTNYISRSSAGSAMTSLSVNPTLEVEFPFYYNYRYAEIGEIPSSSPPDSRYRGVNSHLMVVGATNIYASTTVPSYNLLDFHCAIGEDFSFFFFIGAPVIYASDVNDVTPQPTNP